MAVYYGWPYCTSTGCCGWGCNHWCGCHCHKQFYCPIPQPVKIVEKIVEKIQFVPVHIRENRRWR